ncbi:MAG: dipeptide epimerase [Sphingobacteriales bacterium]|nr:MAG: dipeptide epimerase [Sphingobacteriales bacterium]
MQLRYYPFELAFEHPFTISKGTKIHQPTLVVSLGLSRLIGYGEAPAINYYDVTVAGMIETLEAKKGIIERYALTDPQRYWHFLHHLLPGQNFLIAALDIAGWDLFSQMRRMPLYQLLGLRWRNVQTDYTIGIDTAEKMVAKLQAKPWPIYKIKLGSPNDIDLLRALRQHTDAPFRVDANEGWSLEEAKALLPELQKLGVNMIEQPLPKADWEAMKELKSISAIPLFADESCVTEDDVAKCAEGFNGINIKLTKCGGITPALRMIHEARKLGLKVMIGSMNESTIGTAAIAHLVPLLDEVDADGPLLLKEDVAEGIMYKDGFVLPSAGPGLGIRFRGEKYEKHP